MTRIIHKDVVDRNVGQLDDEADGSHDDETDTDSLRDLKKFLLVGYDSKSAHPRTLVSSHYGKTSHTLDAFIQKLSPIPDKILWHIN